MARSSDPQPPRHGRVIARAPDAMMATHLRKHLSELTAHVNEAKDYGCHGFGKGPDRLRDESDADGYRCRGRPAREHIMHVICAEARAHHHTESKVLRPRILASIERENFGRP